jgi:hypothetical protein
VAEGESMNKRQQARLIWNESFEREAFFQNVYSHQINWTAAESLRKSGLKPKDAATQWAFYSAS